MSDKYNLLDYLTPMGYIENHNENLKQKVLPMFLSLRIPLWFNEGLAVNMELTSKLRYVNAIKEELKKDNSLSIHEVLDKTNYPEDEEKVLLFYSISYSLVDFLRSKGQYRFTNLCRALHDGRNFEDALRTSYQFDFENLERLDKKWQEHIRK